MATFNAEYPNAVAPVAVAIAFNVNTPNPQFPAPEVNPPIHELPNPELAPPVHDDIQPSPNAELFALVVHDDNDDAPNAQLLVPLLIDAPLL